MKEQEIFECIMGDMKERIGHELQRVIENVRDPKTDPKEKREMTVTVTLLPVDSYRENINISSKIGLKLAQVEGILKTMSTEDLVREPDLFDTVSEVDKSTGEYFGDGDNEE